MDTTNPAHSNAPAPEYWQKLWQQSGTPALNALSQWTVPRSAQALPAPAGTWRSAPQRVNFVPMASAGARAPPAHPLSAPPRVPVPIGPPQRGLHVPAPRPEHAIHADAHTSPAHRKIHFPPPLVIPPVSMTPARVSPHHKAAHSPNSPIRATRRPSVVSPRRASFVPHRGDAVMVKEEAPREALPLHPPRAPSLAPTGLVLHVPLPRETDHNFSLPICVEGRPGLRLSSCVWINKQMPNSVVLRDVDNAGRCVDDLMRGGKLIVQKASFWGQRGGTQTYVTSKPPVETGLTVAHLLTLMIRKQYDGWIKAFKRTTAVVDAGFIAGPGEAGDLEAPVSYDLLHVVAIRRSDGKDGRPRWFPQLEVRFE